MGMNNTLYCHLYSDTFDVPHYEKENILYNNKVGSLLVFSSYKVFFFYFILYSENQCISKLDKIGIFIDMKFH